MRLIVFSCANRLASGLHFWMTERPETNQKQKLKPIQTLIQRTYQFFGNNINEMEMESDEESKKQSKVQQAH